MRLPVNNLSKDELFLSIEFPIGSAMIKILQEL